MIILSLAQRRIVSAIRQWNAMHEDYCPSFEDIGCLASRSKTCVHYHVHRLVELGVLDFEDDQGRTVRINSDWDHNPKG